MALTATRIQTAGKRTAGYTLLEMMIVVGIVGILLAVGIPSLLRLFDSMELKGAGEEVYSRIQQARSEAITRDTIIYVGFSAPGTATWAFGVSENANCNPGVTTNTDANACYLVINDGDAIIDGADAADDRVLNRFTSADFDSIVMSLTSFDTTNIIAFEPTQGTAFGNTGTVILQSQLGSILQVRVAPLGQIRICTVNGSINGYPDC